MIDSDLQKRLNALIAALSPPAFPRPAVSDGVDLGGADSQRVATMQSDELLRRISALTRTLDRADEARWDDVDQLAAQLLLADLSIVASTTRSLNDLSAARLAGALAELQSAGIDVQPVVKDAPGS